MTDDEKIRQMQVEIKIIKWQLSWLEGKASQFDAFNLWVYDYLKYVCVFLVISGLINGAFLITRIWV